MRYCGEEGYHEQHEWLANPGTVYPYDVCPGKTPLIGKVFNGFFAVLGALMGLFMFSMSMLFFLWMGDQLFGWIWR